MTCRPFGTKPLSKPMLGYCQLDVNWTLRDKLHWNFNQNTKLFIHENVTENIVCEVVATLSRRRWVEHVPCILKLITVGGIKCWHAMRLPVDFALTDFRNMEKKNRFSDRIITYVKSVSSEKICVFHNKKCVRVYSNENIWNIISNSNIL